MPEIIELTDISLPALDPYFRLTEKQLRSRRRPEDGLFIAESLKVIATALEAGCQPLSLLTEKRHLPAVEREILPCCGELPVFTGSEDLLSSLTGYALTRGVLCAMRRPAPRSPAEVCAGAGRIVILEDLTDTTNLGAVFRSAAALGMDAVLLSPRCVDPLDRRAVRVSMGAVFQIPWARLGDAGERWPKESMSALKQMGFSTVALALRSDALEITDPRLTVLPRLAVLLGTEGTGLTEKTLSLCDFAVRIPMAHGVDSLNVAAAGAVAFWELRART